MTKNRPLGAEFCWSGIVDAVRTYWQTTNDRFFIPRLSLEVAKLI